MKKNFIYVTALVIAVSFSSCGNNSEHKNDGHSHDEGSEHTHDTNVQRTSYSDDFEVYVDITPLAVGQESEILAHFSSLENFKPLENRSVVISLVVDGESVKQNNSAPRSKGIYAFALTPNKVGKGELIFEIGDKRIIVPDIIVYADKHKAAHAAEEETIVSSNGATFTKEQSWQEDFATELSRLERTGVAIKGVGKVVAQPTQKQIIAAKSGGVVNFVNFNLTKGSYVKKGERLATIISSSLASDNIAVRYKEAEANYNLAKNEYERKRGLAEDKIVSQSELQKAENVYLTAKSTYENLKQNFTLRGESVVAPMSGFITEISVNNGGFADIGAQIFSISKNDKVYITAEVSAKYYSELGKIYDAIFTEQSSGKSFSLEELGGEIVSYGKELSSNSTLIPITFAVNNSEVDLLVGSFINVDIMTRGNREVVTVPKSALVEEMGNYFVYKQLTAEYFEKTSVKIGVVNPRRVEIIQGLKNGERVVSKGAVIVKLAQLSGAIEAGHSH